MPLNFDPSKIDQAKLYEYVHDFVERGYSEIDRFYIVINEDLLTTGISRFQVKYREAREWGNRILQMLQDARRMFVPVQEIANGKKMLYESQCAVYVQQHRRDQEMQGLDANERAALSRSSAHCMPYMHEASRWDSLKGELRAFIQALEAKHKDLITARDDLKAQLWSVRLQGIVGDLKPSFQGKTPEPDPEGKDLNFGGESAELDELLGSGDSK